MTRSSSGDVVRWTKRIAALARSGCEAEAVAAFARIDAAPNALTLASVLPACARLRDLAMGRAIHGLWLRRGGGHGANPIVDNAVLDVYAKCGALVSARRLFDEMPERDVFAWTTMVWGLARSGSPHDAVATFRAMLSDCDGDAAPKPNEATVVSALHAVAAAGSLVSCKLLHSYATKRGLGGEMVVVGNALIDAYAKCGDASLAFTVFVELPEKDMVSWGTVTRAMAVHGRCREALQLFSLMLRRGVRPDGTVFLAMLTAFCHAGRVEQALLFLGAMARVYGVSPRREHYTCVLDACGRAGQLDRAGEIFRQMPVEHDAEKALGVYCSYAVSNGVDCVAGERLPELFLDGDVDAGGGTYALMSKSLADAGRWEDACAVRERMAAKRIEKEAACTWIEV